MTYEELNFLSHYLYDKIRESKAEAKVPYSPGELKSWNTLPPEQKKVYELLAFKLVEDFQLEPEKYLKF